MNWSVEGATDRGGYFKREEAAAFPAIFYEFLKIGFESRPHSEILR
jgi:hypothetical protein